MNSKWSRLKINYVDSNMSRLIEGYYTISSGTSGSSIWNGLTDPNGNVYGAIGDFYINTVSHIMFGPKVSTSPMVWPTTGNTLTGIDGNTILNGPNAPSELLGGIGDFYIETTNFRIYGPKQNGVGGAWPTSYTPMVGINGNTIISGVTAPTTQGVEGDFFYNSVTDTFYGPKTAGSWGTGIVFNTIISSAAAPVNSVGVIGDFHMNTLTRTFTGPKTSLTTWTGANTFVFNTIISGTATPPSNTSTGVNGDYYINTSTKMMYGPKASGLWPAGVLMSVADAIRTFSYVTTGTTTGQFTYTPGTYTSPGTGVAGTIVISVTDSRGRTLTNFLTGLNGREIVFTRDDQVREVVFSVINVSIANGLVTFSVFPTGKYAFITISTVPTNTLIDAGFGMPITSLTNDKVINGVNPFIAGDKWILSSTKVGRYAQISFASNTTSLPIAVGSLTSLLYPSVAPLVLTNVPMIWYSSNDDGLLTTHYRGNTDWYQWSISYTIQAVNAAYSSNNITITMAELAPPYTGTPISIGNARTMYTAPNVPVVIGYGGLALFKKDYRYYVRFTGTTTLGITVNEGTLWLSSIDNGMIVA